MKDQEQGSGLFLIQGQERDKDRENERETKRKKQRYEVGSYRKDKNTLRLNLWLRVHPEEYAQQNEKSGKDQLYEKKKK